MQCQSKQGSIVKVKRQLCFDNLFNNMQADLLADQTDTHHTPKTLKSLLDSERKQHPECLSIQDSSDEASVQEIIDDSNEIELSPPRTQKYDQGSRFNESKQKTLCISVDREEDEQCTPIVVGRRSFMDDKYSQEARQTGSQFRGAAWSSSMNSDEFDEKGYNGNNNDDFEEIEQEEEEEELKVVNKKIRKRRQGAKSDMPPRMISNFKMNRIDQLEHLKEIINQKKLHESMHQYKLPASKEREIEQAINNNKENLFYQSRHAAFSAEEKKVIYDENYLQRLGLPVPESVIKQKQQQMSSQAQPLKENNSNISQSANGQQQQTITKSAVVLSTVFVPAVLFPAMPFGKMNEQQLKSVRLAEQQLKAKTKTFLNGDASATQFTTQVFNPNMWPNQFQNCNNSSLIAYKMKEEIAQASRAAELEELNKKQSKIADKLVSKMEQQVAAAAKAAALAEKPPGLVALSRKERLQMNQQQQVRQPLTIEEKKLVYFTWASKNMQDFNYWIQKSKSILEVKYVEEGNSQYTCHLLLKSTKSIGKKWSILIAKARAHSKKESKKGALEKIAWEVIQNDQMFWDGITGNTYIQTLKRDFEKQPAAERDKIMMSSMFGGIDAQKRKAQEEEGEIDDNPKQKFKILKYQRKISELLKQGLPHEALERLAMIGSLKNCLCYRDYCFIWSFAVQDRNFTLMKICLDVVHYRKYSAQMKLILSTVDSKKMIEQLNQQAVDITSKTVNTTLLRNLNVSRSTSENIFEAWNLNCQLLANDEIYFKLIKEQLANQQPITHYSKEEILGFSLNSSLKEVEKLKFIEDSKIKPAPNTRTMIFPSNIPAAGPFEEPFFKRSKEVYPTIQKAKQDPYLQYLSWEDLNSLYQSLLYIDDPEFCLQACELIFAYTKIDEDSFVGNSADFFRIKKLILFQEFFETRLKSKAVAQVHKECVGSLVYIGCNQNEDQFTFRMQKETGEQSSSDDMPLREGDICQVFDAQGYKVTCVIKFVSETFGVYEVKLGSMLFSSMKNNITSGADSSIMRFCSAAKLLEKSKVIDQMCTKVCMHYQIMRALSDPSMKPSTNKSILHPNPLAIAKSAKINLISVESNLNDEQFQAVRHGSQDSLTLISGTAHTGKFKVATCILREWMEQTSQKIVVKCRSEEKARQFFSYFQSEAMKSHKMNDHGVSAILDSRGTGEFLKGKSKQSITQKGNLKLRRAIEESRVIVIGDVSILDPFVGAGLMDCEFSRVMVFQAEQHREDEIWELISRNSTQCVLIGDLTTRLRRQSQSLFAVSRYGDKDILQTFALQGYPVVVLQKRYLTNPTPQSNLISSVHRRLFYESDSCTPCQSADEFLVIAVKGSQECIRDDLEREFYNVYNPHEAHLVAAIASCLIKERAVEHNSILVIAATQSQRHQIERVALTMFHMAVKVLTLNDEIKDSYNYVIYSGVRSNPSGISGRVGHSGTLSLLMQHSVKQLIFVGDIDCYSADPIWREFFSLAHEKRQVKQWKIAAAAAAAKRVATI